MQWADHRVGLKPRRPVSAATEPAPTKLPLPAAGGSHRPLHQAGSGGACRHIATVGSASRQACWRYRQTRRIPLKLQLIQSPFGVHRWPPKRRRQTSKKKVSATSAAFPSKSTITKFRPPPAIGTFAVKAASEYSRCCTRMKSCRVMGRTEDRLPAHNGFVVLGLPSTHGPDPANLDAKHPKRYPRDHRERHQHHRGG